MNNIDDYENLTLRRVKPNPFSGETIEQNSLATRPEDSYNHSQQQYFTASFHNICSTNDGAAKSKPVQSSQRNFGDDDLHLEQEEESPIKNNSSKSSYSKQINSLNAKLLTTTSSKSERSMILNHQMHQMTSSTNKINQTLSSVC